MKYFLSLLFVLLFGLQPSYSQEVFVVNTGFTPPVSTFFKQVLEEAFHRLDIPLLFQEVSAERSLDLVSRGIDDAECCRIPAFIHDDYPSLISVPVSFHTAVFSVFSKDPTVQIRDWQDLQPYHVGTVTGCKVVVEEVAKLQPVGYTKVATPEALLKMLVLDRIDLAAMARRSGLKVIHDLGLEGVHVLEPPLAQEKLYLQLHNRHVDLLPRISKVLQEMEDDGSMDRLRAEVVGD